MDNINTLQNNQRLHFNKKSHLRSLTLAISGQNNLNSAVAHKDKNESALCNICKVKENAEHKLIHCPDLEELRYKTDYMNIESNILEPKEQLDIVKLNAIVRKSNLFN